jgi:hypothetical protein
MKRDSKTEDAAASVKQAKPNTKKLFLPVPTSLVSYAKSALLVTDAHNLGETLARYGVAVIPSVLSEQECAAFEQGMWDSLATITAAWDTPITKDDESSWREFSKLFPMHSMLLQHYSLGHAEFVWALRQNPRVLAIFAELWNVPADELLVSFDGLSVHFPPESIGGGKGWYKGNTWYHTDQRLSDNSYSCIQSWATSRAVNAGDATLTVLLGSHQFHGDFAKRFEKTKHKEDWYKLGSQAELDWYVREKGCEPVSISCPAGSMVFWDSRTMHAGQEPLTTRGVPNFRMAVYLCYTPRSRAAGKKDLEKKQKAFREMRMTSHWPHKGKLFGKKPRTYGAEAPNVSPLPAPTNVSPLGMKLAGF